MILTTQVTKDYYEKAKPFLESVKLYWPFRFVLICIGFVPDDSDCETVCLPLSEVKSYRKDWPTNRPSFCTMQNGEFADVIDCKEDEIIVCVDADSVIQRVITQEEIDMIIDKLKSYDILSVYSSMPPTNLTDVMINLGGPKIDKLKQEKEFTTSILIAKKIFFRELRDEYLYQFDEMTKLTGHHAGVQWLTNVICSTAAVYILSPIIQCGDWYQKFNTELVDGVLKFEGETVLFNHTK
jgi:hypothetical protein